MKCSVFFVLQIHLSVPLSVHIAYEHMKYGVLTDILREEKDVYNVTLEPEYRYCVGKLYPQCFIHNGILLCSMHVCY